MPANLPSSLSYGSVGGRFLTFTADTPTDLDKYPDGKAATGKVKFIPMPKYVTVLTPEPTMIVPATIEGTLDADGYLVDATGARDVTLIAGNDPDTTPTNWAYTVMFEIPGLQIPTYQVVVEADVRKDLAVVSPIPTTPPYVVVVSHDDRVAVAQMKQEIEDLIAGGIPDGGGGTTSAVISVAGKTGAVTLVSEDITNSSGPGRAVLNAASYTAIRTLIGAGTGNGTSNLVLGTTATTAKAGNWFPTAAEVPFTPSGNLSATTVQGALVELMNEGTGGSGNGDTMVWEWSGGQYPAWPATKPVGLKRMFVYGPVAPTSFPSWAGTGTDKARFNYEYDGTLT